MSPQGPSPHTYLPCQVEVGVVCQADRGCLAGLGLVVDGQLPAIKGVGDPDFEVTRVALLTVGAEPEEADAIREHLCAPENLHGAWPWWDRNGNTAPFPPAPGWARNRDKRHTRDVALKQRLFQSPFQRKHKHLVSQDYQQGTSFPVSSQTKEAVWQSEGFCSSLCYAMPESPHV